MREHLPYEKLIAEKMQQFSVPDKEASWQQMKTLLDSEMPISGTGKKGPGGKWWWMSSFAIIIICGTGLLFYLTDKKGSADTIAQQQPRNKTKDTPPSTNHSNTAIDQTSTLNIHPEKENSTSNPSSATVTIATDGNQNTDDLSSIAAQKKDDDIVAKDKSSSATPENSKLEKKKNKTISPQKKTTTADQLVLDKAQTPLLVSAGGKSPAGKNKNNKGSAPTIDHTQNNTLLAKNEYTSHNLISTDEVTVEEGIEKNADAPDSIAAPGITTGYAQNAVLEKVNTGHPRHLIVYADENNPGSIAVPANVWALPDVKAARKMILRDMKRKERKEERDLAKSYKTNQGFWGGKTDRWFAAGISLYQNFAIGSQQTYNYNSGGRKGIAADYIPSPYLQLHLTNKVYLLGEFQFNAPQYTPSLLLSQKNINAPMNIAGCTENIFLRKLYYFNLPLSVHYSPVKNFYMGAGLQFSSFNSGLAYVEQRSSNNALIHSETLKIKDDSLSSKIASSEWRYLVDANYYVNRFMFGFRYSQAMNTNINAKFNNAPTPTQARNQSFQFYIRYNIIVSNKKR